MRNCKEVLLILHDMGLKGKATNNESIIQVVWHPPPSNWIKVSIDNATKGAPGQAGSRGILRNCRGFMKGGFAVPLGVGFAFEAELLSFITAMEINYI